MTALTVSTMDGSCVLTDDDATFETVGDVKLALQDQRGVHRFQLRLMLGERILEDDLTLATLGTAQPRPGEVLCDAVLDCAAPSDVKASTLE